MKQRIIAIIAAAALLMMAVCSCGTSSNPPAGTTGGNVAQNATTAATAATTEATTAATNAATTEATTAASSAATTEATTAATSAAASKEPVKLDLFVDVSWMFDYFNCTPETRTGKVVLEKTGVSINFSKAKTDDSSQINLMFASDDLPDLFCVDSNNNIFPALCESSKVMDLMPLIKSYVPEFYDLMGEGYWNFYKSSTGLNNYYATKAFYPKIKDRVSAFNLENGALLAREDIYTAMGAPGDIDTPEKFKAHLIAVREKYPDLEKTILFHPSRTLNLSSTSHGLSFFKSMFGIEGYYETPDGKIMAAYNHPEYSNYLVWLNSLFLEGFITREDMVRTGESRAAVIGKADIYMYYDSEVGTLAYPPAGHPETRWTAFPAFKTSKIMKGGNLFWLATLMSSKCKDPEAAIRLMSYMASPEGDRLNDWGQEGIDYEWLANGAPARTKAYIEAHTDSVAAANWDNARGSVCGFMNWADSEFETLCIPNDEPWMKRSRDLYQDYYFWRLNFMGIDPVGNMPENIIIQQCRDYFDEMIPEIIMADSESGCLALFETLKKELASKGIADVEAYWTAQSNKRKDAFGADNLVIFGADNELYHKLYG